MTRTDRPLDSSQNVEIYRELVYQLTCDTTDEKKVKTLMQKLGLKYSTERIDRLSEVLAYTPSHHPKGALHDL
jgi:hypothetical protein